ncbi:hypothetical protein [Rhodococcus ruber]|uniref:hypothetical protein n=1 Tax=Rhodococcus ruber TaxID=1830 RepID=UPI00034560F3|nr:hypothetical protein [Rhodococcus ruber]
MPGYDAALRVIVLTALGDDTRENLQEVYDVAPDDVVTAFMGLANDALRLGVGRDSRG